MWWKELLASAGVALLLLGAGLLLDQGQRDKIMHCAQQQEKTAEKLPPQEKRIYRKYPSAVMPARGGEYLVYVSPEESKHFIRASHRAAEDWHIASGLDFVFTPDKKHAQIRIRDGKNKSIGKNIEGIEQTWVTDVTQQHIFGVITIRTALVEERGNDLSKVIAHEIGHAIGLNHSKRDKRDIMYRDDNGDNRNQVITFSDEVQAVEIHNKLCVARENHDKKLAKAKRKAVSF